MLAVVGIFYIWYNSVKGCVEFDDIRDQVENDYLRKVEEKGLRDYLVIAERADIDQTASQLQPAVFRLDSSCSKVS